MHLERHVSLTGRSAGLAFVKLTWIRDWPRCPGSSSRRSYCTCPRWRYNLGGCRQKYNRPASTRKRAQTAAAGVDRPTTQGAARDVV